MVRALALTVAAAAGILLFEAEARADACERQVDERDILIDVKGDDLSVAIVSSDGPCDLVYLDVWGLDQRHPYGDVPWYVALKLTDSRGEVLSTTDMYGDWWSQFAFSQGPPMWGKKMRLAPGEAHVVRTRLSRFLSLLEGIKQHEGRSSLPWGQQVKLELQVTVHSYTGDSAPRRRTVEVTSPTIVYRLPSKRPE